VRLGVGDGLLDRGAMEGHRTRRCGEDRRAAPGLEAPLGSSFSFHAGDPSQNHLEFFHGAQTGGSDDIDLLGGPDHSFIDLMANQHISQMDADVVNTDGGGRS
jgi:hypothetical protein